MSKSLIDALVKEHLGSRYLSPGYGNPLEPDRAEEEISEYVAGVYEDYSDDREALVKKFEAWAKGTGFKFDVEGSVKLQKNDIDWDNEGDLYMAEMEFSLKAAKGTEITLLGKTTTTSDEVTLNIEVQTSDAEAFRDMYKWIVDIHGLYDSRYHVDLGNADHGSKNAVEEILKDLEAALGDYVNSKTASTNAEEQDGVQSLTSLSEVMFEIEQIGKQMRSARDERSVVDAIGQELMDLAQDLKKNKFIDRVPGMTQDIGMNLRRLSETFDNIHGDGETEFLGDMVRQDGQNWREKAKEVLEILEEIDKQLDKAMAESKKIS